jgi:hypothetical protein
MQTPPKPVVRDARLRAKAAELVSQLPPDPDEALTVLRYATELFVTFLRKEADNKSAN